MTHTQTHISQTHTHFTWHTHTYMKHTLDTHDTRTLRDTHNSRDTNMYSILLKHTIHTTHTKFTWNTHHMHTHIWNTHINTHALTVNFKSMSMYGQNISSLIWFTVWVIGYFKTMNRCIDSAVYWRFYFFIFPVFITPPPILRVFAWSCLFCLEKCIGYGNQWSCGNEEIVHCVKWFIRKQFYIISIFIVLISIAYSEFPEAYKEHNKCIRMLNVLLCLVSQTLALQTTDSSLVLPTVTPLHMLQVKQLAAPLPLSHLDPPATDNAVLGLEQSLQAGWAELPRRCGGG